MIRGLQRFAFRVFVGISLLIASLLSLPSFAYEQLSPTWIEELPWDDETPLSHFDPDAFAAAHFEWVDVGSAGAPTPSQMERILSESLREAFPLRVKQAVQKLMKAPQGFDPTQAQTLPQGFELQTLMAAFEDSVKEAKTNRARNRNQGILETDASGTLRLRVFRGFGDLGPAMILESVAEGARIAGSSLTLSETDVRLIQEQLEHLTEEAIATTNRLVDDREIKGISSLSPTERFRIHMDSNRFQIPSKKVRDQMKEAGRQAELDEMLHSEFTAIDKTPIVRIVLPHLEETFLLIDSSFTDAYAPHMLMLIGRQLQRAKGGEGRPVVLLTYSPATGEATSPKLEAQVLLKPQNLYDSLTATKISAMMPPTKNEVAWSTVYTAYMIFCWYFTKFTANWGEVPSIGSAGSDWNDLLRFAGEMGAFLQKYSTGIESHIFYSAVIGLCYSAYTYLIFDKNVPAWKQTIRHLMLISMPAGLWTIAQVNDWGLQELFLSEVGIFVVMHALVNSLINNVSRAFSHSIFSARDGHRVGMGEVPFLGFRFKKQQFYRELLTFPLLFMTKIAHLLKLHPEALVTRDASGDPIAYAYPLLDQIPGFSQTLGLLSLGELSFYAFPFAAFVGAYSYLRWKDDGVNYHEDRKKLLRDALAFVKAPVVIPYQVGRWSCRKALHVFRSFQPNRF